MDPSHPLHAPRATRVGWRAALLLLVVSGAVWKFTRPAADGLTDPQAQPRAVAPAGESWPEEAATIRLFEEASPSVVYVRNITIERGTGLFNMDPTQVLEDTGSGFLWDSQGHVVTNYHVVHGGSKFRVTLANHKTLPARIVGIENEKDIAVLKIESDDGPLQPIKLGSSANLKIGQKVFAIGNPFGLDQTLSDGIISGLGREIMSQYVEAGRGSKPITDLIQTNAAINPGNSGGPLLDSSGRLIGMNTAIVSPTGTYAGIGFAIPVDTINRVVTDVIRFGKATRPGLGIQAAMSLEHGVPRVTVRSVMPGSAAESAGLHDEREPAADGLPDSIVAIDGRELSDLNDLYRELERHQVGDRVTLVVLRNGRKMDVNVTLQDVHVDVPRR